LIKRQTERTLELQMQTEAIVIDRSEIAGVKASALSLMPDGLFDNLNAHEIRDLIAYLAQPTQAPLPGAQAGGILKQGSGSESPGGSRPIR
jgi:hypothetical protein